MSSASTINLPFIKCNMTAPAFASGVPFNLIIENNTSIPIGNYLVWTSLIIEGDTDTDLGPVATALLNGPLFENVFNPGGSLINDGSLTFQNSQIVIITTEQPNIIFQCSLLFGGNDPTIVGTISFLPI